LLQSAFCSALARVRLSNLDPMLYKADWISFIQRFSRRLSQPGSGAAHREFAATS